MDHRLDTAELVALAIGGKGRMDRLGEVETEPADGRELAFSVPDAPVPGARSELDASRETRDLRRGLGRRKILGLRQLEAVRARAGAWGGALQRSIELPGEVDDCLDSAAEGQKASVPLGR